MSVISFQSVFIAIFQIFLMGSVGFFLVRQRFLSEEALKVLSWVGVNISFPCFIFYQITTHFNPSFQPQWWAYPLINVGLVLAGVIVAVGLCRLTGKKRPSEWIAVSGLHNAGFLPILLITFLPLAEQSPQLYTYFLLTVIGFDLCVWSLGVVLLTQHQKGKINIRHFMNPPILSMLLAFAVVLCGQKSLLPDIALKPIKVLGDSALALAMLTIGGNLALTRFHRGFWKDIGGAVIIKLLILPVMTLIFLELFHVSDIWGLVLMIQSCMPSAITLSIIGRAYNNPHQDLINQTIFVTHLLCILTVPFFLGLYGRSF